MTTIPITTTPALKYETTVQANGRIELTVPFTPGNKVIIFIIQEPRADEDFSVLVQAAETSMAFWDNTEDDEDWNTA